MPIMKLVIATGNPGKVQEFRKILGDSNFEFLTLKDIGFSAEIVEDGDSFAANALIKAKAIFHYLKAQGLNYPVLADDSGLEVDALGGAPGIFTARYAGVGATDQQNYQKLLTDLAGNPNRKARFVCWLCWFDAHGHQLFSGDCAGHILSAPRGEHGFGYDPVFEPMGYTRSFGEMDHDEKKSLSHRGEAIKHLQIVLATHLHS